MSFMAVDRVGACCFYIHARGTNMLGQSRNWQ